MFEQIVGKAAQQRDVAGGVTVADLRTIFAIRHVHYPVTFVFNAPVAATQLQEFLRIGARLVSQ